ncbi:nucleotidyltransferase family protein [Methanoregula sp.]|uniref:nucleotidyltransferase family protein n=1 Tax=Methanoregula sp. TaxID=2052170 RepID=UPI003BB1BCD8
MKNLADIQKIFRDHEEILRDQYKVKILGLFGSYVRGDHREDSDLDVLVEFSEGASLLDHAALQNYLTELVSIRVDVVPKKNIRKELKDQISNETVYL